MTPIPDDWDTYSMKGTQRLKCIMEEMAAGATVEGLMPPPGETEENCKICCEYLGNSGTQGGGGPPYMGGGVSSRVVNELLPSTLPKVRIIRQRQVLLLKKMALKLLSLSFLLQQALYYVLVYCLFASIEKESYATRAFAERNVSKMSHERDAVYKNLIS